MIPNYCRKMICGWSNYSGMVISCKMSENEMGNRGSKSEIILSPQPQKVYSVKEQRVDGSYLDSINVLQKSKLRCILMGFERNYQFKILSKCLNRRLFSTMTVKPKLNPWFFTGFTDAEGCFSIKIQPNANLKMKWRVRPVFSITLHKKEFAILESIQNGLFDSVGKIHKSGKKAIIYEVDSLKDLTYIIDHFDKYPLITKKVGDYLIWKQCIQIIKQGEHLNEKGLLEIISLKSSLNLGLPENVKKSFPNIQEKNRPMYTFKGIPDPFWISGFISGDGSFHIVYDLTGNKPRVLARFGIHLHIRDLEILKGILAFFKVEKNISIRQNSATLQIAKFADLTEKIIPFFDQYTLLGTKSLDFEDFKKICDIIKTKEHLTSPLLFKKILDIKSGMNLNRKW